MGWEYLVLVFRDAGTTTLTAWQSEEVLKKLEIISSLSFNDHLP